METTLTYLEMLVEAIREMCVEYGDKVIKITISIGVATGNGDSVDKVLCTADNRLYHAKKRDVTELSQIKNYFQTETYVDF